MAAPLTPPKKTAPVDLKVRRHKVTPDASANETTLQRFLDTQSDTVDGVLAWLNSSFAYTAPPKPTSKAIVNPALPLTTKAGLTVGGALSATSVASAGAVTASSVASAGSVTAMSVTASGSVSAASMASSGPVSAASVTSSGTVTAGSVNSSGPVSGTTATFPSSAFKAVVGPFAYGGSYPGGIIACSFNYGSVTMGTNTYGFVMPFAGSIVAINGRSSISVATSFQPYYYINGTSTLLSNTAVAANNVVSWGLTYAKGAFPVSAGTVVGMGVGWSATGTGQFTGFFTIEMAP